MTSATASLRLRVLGIFIPLVLLLVGDAPAAERVTIATPSRGLFEFPVVVAMRKGNGTVAEVISHLAFYSIRTFVLKS